MNAANVVATERALRFFHNANVAAAEAIRLRREPYGGPLSAVRREDAKALRRVAVGLLKS